MEILTSLSLGISVASDNQMATARPFTPIALLARGIRDITSTLGTIVSSYDYLIRKYSMTALYTANQWMTSTTQNRYS